MLVIALALAVVVGAANHSAFANGEVGTSVFTSLVMGLLFAVPAWIAYRLGRFVVLPRRR